MGVAVPYKASTPAEALPPLCRSSAPPSRPGGWVAFGHEFAGWWCAVTDDFHEYDDLDEEFDGVFDQVVELCWRHRDLEGRAGR